MIYAIIGAVVTFLAFLVWYGLRMRGAGEAEITAKTAEKTADVLRKQGDAVVNAPQGKAEVVTRLREKGL